MSQHDAALSVSRMTDQHKDWVAGKVLEVLQHIQANRDLEMIPPARRSLPPESTGLRVDLDVWDAVYKRSA